MSIDERQITIKAIERSRGQMFDALVRIFKAYPEMVQYGVAGLTVPAPTQRQLRDERRVYEGIEDPDEFARLYAERIASSSPSEAAAMLTPQRWDIAEPEEGRLF